MKKSLAIVTLAVCAMTITSCGAPAISLEQAKVEANQIRATMESNGEYVAGKTLEVNYRIFQEEKAMGITEGSDVKGNIQIDVDSKEPYVRTFTEMREYAQGYGEKEEAKATTESWTYVSGQYVVFGYKYTENGTITDEGETSVAITNAGSELTKDIEEAYYEISKVFEGAVQSIFTYLSFFPTEEALAKAGIKLGSYGPGSLVVSENVSARNGGAWAKSDTTIEFKDYRLDSMKSTFDQGNEVMSQKGDMEYTFNYAGFTKKY